MRPILLALLCVAAWPCPTVRAASPDVHDPKTEGAVFFSLPKNRPADNLVLKAASGGKEYGVAARPVGKDGPLGNVSWLPAGQYSLASWNGIKLADYPAVTIEAGRLTDGGTILAFPVGDSKLVVLAVRPDQTAHDVDAALSELGPALTNPEPLRWEMAVPPKPVELPAPESPLAGLIPQLLTAYEAHVNKATPHKRLLEATSVESFYAVAKEATPPLTSVAVVDPQGRLLYGGDFGQIRLRTPGGEWASIDTGSLHVVTSIAADGPRLLAGYDDGAVRASDDKGLTWHALPVPPLGAQITAIEHVGPRWVLVAATRRSADARFPPTIDKIRVFAASEPDLKDAALLREFKPEDGTYIVPHAEHEGDKVYLNVPPALWRLDVGTGAWTSLATPGDVADFHLGNPGTVAAWRAKGIFSKLFVSKDDGGSWTKIDHPSLMIADIRMFDTEHGVAVRWNPGAFTNMKEIYDYDKSHDEWRLASQAPQGCLRLLVDETRHPRYCVTSGASILALTDGKWVAEYSTQ